MDEKVAGWVLWVSYVIIVYCQTIKKSVWLQLLCSVDFALLSVLSSPGGCAFIFCKPVLMCECGHCPPVWNLSGCGYTRGSCLNEEAALLNILRLFMVLQKAPMWQTEGFEAWSPPHCCMSQECSSPTDRNTEGWLRWPLFTTVKWRTSLVERR